MRQAEQGKLNFRREMDNATYTRKFGIPNALIGHSNFANQGLTGGGTAASSWAFVTTSNPSRRMPANRQPVRAACSYWPMLAILVG